jgi:hypothetical protein
LKYMGIPELGKRCQQALTQVVQSQLHRGRLITMWLRLVGEASSHTLVKVDRHRKKVLKYDSPMLSTEHKSILRAQVHPESSSPSCIGVEM